MSPLNASHGSGGKGTPVAMAELVDMLKEPDAEKRQEKIDRLVGKWTKMVELADLLAEPVEKKRKEILEKVFGNGGLLDKRGRILLDHVTLSGESTNSLLDLRDANLEDLSMIGATLTNVDLSGASLNSAHLARAVLNNVRTSETTFGGADLTESIWSMCSLVRTRFDAAVLDGAIFKQSTLIDVEFGKQMHGASFEESTISRAVFGDLLETMFHARTRISESRFKGSLSQVKFADVEFKDVRLLDVQCTDTVFIRCKFDEVRAGASLFKWSSFEESSLDGFDLSAAEWPEDDLRLRVVPNGDPNGETRIRVSHDLAGKGLPAPPAKRIHKSLAAQYRALAESMRRSGRIAPFVKSLGLARASEERAQCAGAAPTVECLMLGFWRLMSGFGTDIWKIIWTSSVGILIHALVISILAGTTTSAVQLALPQAEPHPASWLRLWKSWKRSLEIFSVALSTVVDVKDVYGMFISRGGKAEDKYGEFAVTGWARGIDGLLGLLGIMAFVQTIQVAALYLQL